MKIIRKKSFQTAYHKLKKSLQKKIDTTLLLFEKNPFEKSLNNHSLKGTLLGLRSVNVTGDIRILFEEIDGYVVVVLVTVGTHSQLY